MNKDRSLQQENNFARLVRFLLGYALVIAVLLYALPVVAAEIETLYESMSRVLRFGAVVLFAASVGGWYFLSQRTAKSRKPSDPVKSVHVPPGHVDGPVRSARPRWLQ